MNKISIGIDPGKNGAIAINGVDDKIMYYTIPKISKDVDLSGLHRIMGIIFNLDGKKHIVIENVHSIFGSSAKSNFQFGWINGVMEGMIVSYGIPYTKVSPKAWQKEMWQGVSPIMINTGKKKKDGSPKYKTDTKATSLLAAKRLFPNENFLATERSKVPHDGIIDAILLSEYCKRKINC